MEPITTHRAVLQFKSNTNEAIRISIPRAKLDISEAQARETMEAMIAGDIIVTGAGRPAAVKRMDVVTTHRVPLV
jgi:hypothetical protein